MPSGPTGPAPSDPVGGADGPARPHRPGRYADLSGYLDARGADLSTEHRAEIAASTAAAVIAQGRRRTAAADSDAEADFVGLADRVGLDTLTELWRDAGPSTLPGALWTLYVLRQWCRTDGERVVRLWRAGEPLAPADAVVAGVAARADAEDVARFAHAVLAGVYGGDVDVALERAAAFLRVVAMGRRWYAEAADVSPEDVTAGPRLDRGGVGTDDVADRNERAAHELGVAAQRWRAGTLN